MVESVLPSSTVNKSRYLQFGSGRIVTFGRGPGTTKEEWELIGETEKCTRSQHKPLAQRNTKPMGRTIPTIIIPQTSQWRRSYLNAM